MLSLRFHYTCLPTGIVMNCLVLVTTASYAQPQIGQIVPGSGPVGTTVTISGNGFSANPASNIVYFGATRASVSAASANSLTVVAPAGATYQPLTVTVNGLTGSSALPFIVTFPGGQPFTQLGGSSQQDAFEPEIDSPTDLHPNIVAVADFDGDGKPDIATANNYSTTGQLASISILRNTGTIGKISTGPRYDMPSGVLTYAVAAGDLDGDGKPDLISCSNYNQTISVFRNTSSIGAISFASEIDYPSGHEPFSIVVADIDLDGRPDVIVCNVLGNSVSVFRNTTTNGVISLAPPIDFAAGLAPQDVVAGDLDGDGKPDLAIVNALSNTLSILRNTSSAGSISFAARVDLATANSPFGLAIGDLDGDNRQDIVVVNNGANSFSVFRNTSSVGSVSFATRTDNPCNASPYRVALADLNGDGKIDIYISSDNATVTQNASTPGTIAFAGQINLFPRYVAYGIGIADLDGDGKSDLMSPSFSASGIAFLRNKDNEPTILYFSPTDAVTGTVVTIVGHHFDGTTGVEFGGVPAATYTVANADTILATVGIGSSGSVGVSNQYGTNRLAGFFFHGPPVITRFTPVNAGAHDTIQLSGIRFTGATIVSFGGMPAASFVVNSDTSIIAIVDSGSTGSIVVTTPYGTGSLAGFTYFHVPTITNFTPTGGGAGTPVTITGSYFTGVTGVSLGGVPATSFTVNSSNSITAIVGEGAIGYLAVTSPGGTGLSDTTFAFPLPLITAINTDSAAVGSSITITGANFRSDPSADIVYFGAARAEVNSASRTSLTVTVPTGANYAPISVAVNNRVVTTPRPFIATFPPGASPLTDSSFAWRGAFSVNENPEQLRVADLDGDGKPDIITADFTYGQISVLRNTSTINHPSFTAAADLTPASIGTVLYPVIAVGDINADGKPDIVICNFASFSVYINTSANGKLSFAAPQNFSIPYTDVLEGIALADFDGDGRIDVAIMTADPYSVSTLALYRNTGEGSRLSFASGVGYGTGDICFQLKTADFDNDGKIDIAAVSDQRIDVFRNTGSPGIISFSLAGNFASNLAQGCEVADVDGDGLQDLVSTGFNNQTYTYIFSVIKNTSTAGSISFNAKVDSTIYLPTTIDPIYPSAGQIDGDGKIDMVLVDQGGTNEEPFSVYRNTGGNSGIPFTGGNRYPAKLQFGYARQATILDIDGDGKADIVVGNDVDNAVSVYRNQMGESNLMLCANSDTVIAAGKSGTVYQWQLGTGGAFGNLSDNANYAGTGSSLLRLHSVPAGFAGYQYRCLVDGVPGTITDLVVNPDTLLSGTASGPTRACSGDTVTVTFTGATVPLNAPVQLWVAIDSGSFALTGQKTYSGTALNFSVRDSAVTRESYFFYVSAPTGASSCTIGVSSDTVVTAITQPEIPLIALGGNVLRITNPDTAETYTWQSLDPTTGVWQGGGSEATDTLTQSGTYRVLATELTCEVHSNVITYTKPAPTGGPPPADSTAIRFYPNPATSVFILDSLKASDSWVTLEIIEAQSGRRLSITPILGQTRVVLQVGYLVNGIYLAVLRRADGSQEVIKFLRL
ncbi:MAG TPA: FG-GAP-like repeat-containing protein [Puia sp.]|nr:FG-GAP-like repeat-containing protein [Puia sp.]